MFYTPEERFPLFLVISISLPVIERLPSFFGLLKEDWDDSGTQLLISKNLTLTLGPMRSISRKDSLFPVWVPSVAGPRKER